MKLSGAGLAELVDAVALFKPNAAGVEAIARMCGLELQSREADLRPSEPLMPMDDPADSPAGSLPPAGDVQAQSLPPSVRHLKPVRQDSRTIRTDPLASTSRGSKRVAPGFEGLLTPRDGIELLRMASSVSIATNRIDVERAVAHLANAHPLTELPLLQTKSLAFGAQVLVDIGQSMQQFNADQQDLIARIGKNLSSIADIRYFADDPMGGCGKGRRRFTWSEYALPDPKVPVIALTDLGCGFPRRPVAIRAWVRLAETLRRRHSRVVVFAPITLSRIPHELARVVDLVHWDRSAIRRNVMQLAGARDE